jgi:hypothetical protein
VRECRGAEMSVATGLWEEEVMRSTIDRVVLRGLFTIGGILSVGIAPAKAQMAMSGSGRSLGGYGASAASSYYGGGGGGYMPYNGGSGYVPFRGGYGGGMGVQPVPRTVLQTTIGGVMMATTPIGGSSLSGGMGTTSRGGMGMAGRSGSRTTLPLGYGGGVGMGSMGTMSTSGAGSMGQAPPGPGFGYPFRMPPPLSGSSTMSMP